MSQSNRLVVSRDEVLLTVILLILTTYLRLSLLLVAPIIFAILYLRLGFVSRKYILVLVGIIAVSLFISYSDGYYFKYNLLSFYYIIPFLIFLFSKPKYHLPRQNLFDSFMKILTVLTVVNNLIGYVQYIIYPNDDSFSGLYGHFTVTQNGLAIVNAILFYYYFRKTFHKPTLRPLLSCAFFGISFIMGFYGGGILVLAGAMIMQINIVDLSKAFKKILAACMAILAIGLLLFWIRPDTLRYNINIIKIFAGSRSYHPPRKLLSYANYVNGYTSNTKDLLFGSGPGTFNSRTAFTIGSPEYFKIPGVFKAEEKPYYFEKYAYSLWNSANTIKFEDGFMNQPFSSLLAFLGEYGLVFTLFFALYYFRQHKMVAAFETFSADDKIAKDTYKFCSVLLVLLLIIDNYAEYPEITILILSIMKLGEMSLIKSKVINEHTDNA